MSKLFLHFHRERSVNSTCGPQKNVPFTKKSPQTKNLRGPHPRHGGSDNLPPYIDNSEIIFSEKLSRIFWYLLLVALIATATLLIVDIVLRTQERPRQRVYIDTPVPECVSLNCFGEERLKQSNSSYCTRRLQSRVSLARATESRK